MLQISFHDDVRILNYSLPLLSWLIVLNHEFLTFVVWSISHLGVYEKKISWLRQFLKNCGRCMVIFIISLCKSCRYVLGCMHCKRTCHLIRRVDRSQFGPCACLFPVRAFVCCHSCRLCILIRARPISEFRANTDISDHRYNIIFPIKLSFSSNIKTCRISTLKSY